MWVCSVWFQITHGLDHLHKQSSHHSTVTHNGVFTSQTTLYLCGCIDDITVYSYTRQYSDVNKWILCPFIFHCFANCSKSSWTKDVFSVWWFLVKWVATCKTHLICNSPKHKHCMKTLKKKLLNGFQSLIMKLPFQNEHCLLQTCLSAQSFKMIPVCQPTPFSQFYYSTWY